MGRSWTLLASLVMLLGGFWALLGRSWVALGAILVALGGVFGHAGRSWELLNVPRPIWGAFRVFLGACFVRRFSLNALSVPPLGQVQDQFEMVLDGFETGSRRVRDVSKF